jgi:hypothetical protein
MRPNMLAKPMLHAAVAAVVPFILSGCGSSPSPAPAPAPVPPQCSLPSLQVPYCGSNADAKGKVQDYMATNHSNHSDCVPATWPTVTEVCWNDTGIIVESSNTDHFIFQECMGCGCKSRNKGSMAGVFLAPVSNPDDVPKYYYELEVGAMHGAFAGGIIVNSLGDDIAYPSIYPCSAAPSNDNSFASCDLNCTGSILPSVEVATGHDQWSYSMTVPWTMFAETYTPVGNGGQPWQHWRGNFYRFSYPNGYNTQFSYERSGWSPMGWSPTHDRSFHMPEMFGTMTFMPKTLAIQV